MTLVLKRQIHLACRDLGLDEDARRAVQFAACGKTSMREMDVGELRLVINHLKARGWKTKTMRRKAAPRGDIRFAHVLWGKLVAAGVMHERGAKGLNAFVLARFAGSFGAAPLDIDMMRDARQIATIVHALKEICTRNAVPY